MAVVDDGVDITHPDYATSFSGAQGYDLMYGTACQGDSFHPHLNDTHGTAVAGLIAADHNNGQGVAGVAPGVVLNSVRWNCGFYPPGPYTVATSSQLADGINWAWQFAGSHIINMSLAGTAPNAPMQNAINQATSLGRAGKGSVVIVAAGNSHPTAIGFPGTLPNVVTVGAITLSGPRAAYSQTGASLDIVAPSGPSSGQCFGAIVTLDLFGSPGCTNGPNGDNNYTDEFTGRSAAVPQVAGAAALMIARDANLTEYQVRWNLC